MKCVRTKRVCGGYQRDAIFVIEQVTGENAMNLPSKAYVATYRKSDVVKDKSNKEISTNVQNDKAASSTVVPAASTFAPDLEISSPAAFRQQFFMQFLSTFVPDIDQAVMRLKVKTEESTWLVLVPELPEVTRALDTSIMALSTARLGRTNDDKRLVIESRKLYAEGLKYLQRALYDPKLMYRDESRYTTMAYGSTC